MTGRDRDLVERADDVARREHPRHAGAAMGIHDDVASLVQPGAQRLRKRGSRLGAERRVEDIESCFGAVAQAEQDAPIVVPQRFECMGVETTHTLCMQAGPSRLVHARLRVFAKDADLIAEMPQEQRFATAMRVAADDADALAGELERVADRALSQQAVATKRVDSPDAWLAIAHPGRDEQRAGT